MLGSFHIDTGAIVAITISLLIVAFACMVWIFRKTGCGFLRNSRQQMRRRSNNIHLPNHTDNSMPLTELQGHNPFCFSKGNAELGVSSALPPQSILVNSKQCPSPPSHAYIPGTGPLLSPSISPYISKNHVNITASDRTTHDGQDVTLQPSEASLERIETRISLPVTHSVLPNVAPQKRENPSTLPLGKRIAPGLKSSKLRIQTNIHSATYTSIPENLPILVSDVKGSDLKSRILKENSHSSSPLPVSLVDCPDYLSPSTSLAWKRSSTVRTRMAFTKLQVPSPPSTPMTYPALSRATPIVKEWLSQEVAEDTKTWSDVLSFSEYEREEHLIHAQRFSVANHLPSPPPTPALSFTPPTPSLSTTTGQPEAQWPSAMNTSWTREHAYGRANVDIHDTAFRPQAGGGGDSLVVPMSHYRQLPANMEVWEEGLSKTQDDLPAYDDFGRDYETRLALKRVTSLLAKPVKPVKPTASTTRIFFKEVASVVRPRPPPIDYEPLLLRTVDSSKFKARAQLPRFKVPPAALRSTSPTTRRERTRFGTKGEVSPHVQVLELLIAHVSDRRTGDIPLGTL